MHKWQNEVRDAIAKEGFEIISFEVNKHYKVTLSKDGVQFFVIVSKTTSDTYRGLRRVVQSIRQQFGTSKRKLLTPIAGSNTINTLLS